MRSAIARRMTLSQATVPPFSVTTDIEMDASIAALEERNTGRATSERVSLTAVVIEAVAVALQAHPRFNAVWDGETLLQISAVNVGVAIALDDGLVAPAVLDCAGLSVDVLGDRLRDLVARTKGGRIRLAEMNDATFTLSNLGMFDVTSFTAIVTPPQVAVLAIGRTQPGPAAVDDRVEIRQIMTATLSADHRAVDGASGARFLETVKQRLEQASWRDR